MGLSLAKEQAQKSGRWLIDQTLGRTLGRAVAKRIWLRPERHQSTTKTVINPSGRAVYSGGMRLVVYDGEGVRETRVDTDPIDLEQSVPSRKLVLTAIDVLTRKELDTEEKVARAIISEAGLSEKFLEEELPLDFTLPVEILDAFLAEEKTQMVRAYLKPFLRVTELCYRCWPEKYQINTLLVDSVWQTAIMAKIGMAIFVLACDHVGIEIRAKAANPGLLMLQNLARELGKADVFFNWERLGQEGCCIKKQWGAPDQEKGYHLLFMLGRMA